VAAKALPHSAHASSNLRFELAVVANELVGKLKEKGEDAVVIGQFTGPPQLSTSAGAGIAEVLTDELRKRGISVKRRARFGIKGEFQDVIDAQSNLLAAKISGQLIDRRGEVLHEFSRGVFGDATLPALFGITASLPPDANDKERSKRLQDGLDNPVYHVATHRVTAAPGSPYGIEVHVKEDGRYRPQTPVDEDGWAFVSIRRDQSYGVRLINNSPYGAAVTLTIDGINMFAFSEKAYTQVIVAPNSSTLIKGWHRNNKVTEEFLVTRYSESAAAELNSAADLGVITASFRAAWAPETEPPADEPADPSPWARGADATGRGAHVPQEYEEVLRHFGVIRASVSVRYTK